jgi:hypothetical protein
MAVLLLGLLAGVLPVVDGRAADRPVTDSGKPDKKPAAPAKAAQPDEKFLEYLGTLEGEGEDWTDVAATDLLEQVKSASKAKAVAKPEKK